MRVKKDEMINFVDDIFDDMYKTISELYFDGEIDDTDILKLKNDKHNKIFRNQIIKIAVNTFIYDLSIKPDFTFGDIADERFYVKILKDACNKFLNDKKIKTFESMTTKDKMILKALSEKYGYKNINNAINKLNENINTKMPLFCGIRGIYLIDHGNWADPELKYKNYICNYWDIEDSMVQYMKERIADGEDWGDPSNDDDFCRFCRAHANEIKEDIIEFSIN